jgi:hypothetical protein
MQARAVAFDLAVAKPPRAPVHGGTTRSGMT